MIKVTAKGNTKQFEPGMTVNEILNAFDVQYLRFACAVEMNGKIVGMDEKVVSDCELKPLTFNDLSKRNMTADQIDDRLVSDNQPYSGLSDGEEVSGQPLSFSDSDQSSEYGDLSDESEDDGASAFDGMGSVADVLSQLEEQNQARAESEVSAASDESADEADNDNADDAFNDTETLPPYDDIFDDIGPETDGEFVSVIQPDAGELSPEMVGYDADSIFEEPDADDSCDDGSSSDDSADYMQMHLGVPKIDDLVSELLMNMEPDDADTGSADAAGDYSVDDEDMDEFLVTRILPEEIQKHEEYAESAESIEESPKPMPWWNTNFDVDENSIDEFVDYGKSVPASEPAEKEASADRSTDDRKGKKGSIPVFVKAAAFALVLLGIGCAVGSIAIQAVGAPGAFHRIERKPVVSVSDVSSVSDTDSSSSDDGLKYDRTLLSPGKSNALVKAVQERLCELGYLKTSAADGVYNKATVKAIDSFRKANGIDTTGVIDGSTFKKLFDKKAKTTVTTLSTDATVTTTTGSTVSTTKKKSTTTVSKTTASTKADQTTTTTAKKTTKKKSTTTVSKTTTSTEADQTTTTTAKKTTKKTTQKTTTTKKKTTTTTKKTTTKKKTTTTTKKTTQKTTESNPSTTEETTNTTTTSATTTTSTTKGTTSTTTTTTASTTTATASTTKSTTKSTTTSTAKSTASTNPTTDSSTKYTGPTSDKG